MNSIPAVMKLKVMGSLSFRNSLKTVFYCLGLSLCAYCLGPIPAPWKRRNVVLGPAVKPGCQRFWSILIAYLWIFSFNQIWYLGIVHIRFLFPTKIPIIPEDERPWRPVQHKLIDTLHFLPRDAMHKRGLCRHAVSVCLSVCVSVTFVDCVKTNKHIFHFFSPSGSHTILVFPCQTA